mmetsp:Transcript_12740/g.21485  ORF Transcript_12740/g.21485 Transcript_12740/m.21485 type:complete len:344 (-) Transcript_12740:167-1198(-)|eukprot:CAMPEP_0168607818 /NCGR_PEP_ID=MMETSP0449_2-20121227/269_1 /TAXON_ID=1082188 /ORGANISM="Strombidium rassoulzadegani, Strain ras09" /LENGTH=343 /DNA_ID=CAMNT_0008647707 /DNA_START=477 /DNA_END=1508 /DNA_ORIENTATION=-
MVSVNEHESEAGWTEVHLQNLENVNYVGEIRVGNPMDKSQKPQRMKCVFDSGSSNTWLSTDYSNLEDFESLDLEDDEGFLNSLLDSGSVYDPSKSSSFQLKDFIISIKFGSGKLSGYMGSDDIYLNYQSTPRESRMRSPRAAFTSRTLKIENQDLGFSQSSSVFDQSFNCIFGMAYKKMAVKGTLPVMDNIQERQLLRQNVFSFYLSLGTLDHQMGLNSKIVIGKIDMNDVEGDITWFKVVDKDFWALKLVDIKYGDRSLGLCGPKSGNNCLITPDTGTSCLTFPKVAYDKVKSVFPSHESCLDDKAYPSLTYSLEDEQGNFVDYELKSQKHVAIKHGREAMS